MWIVAMAAALCVVWWLGQKFFNPDRSKAAQLMKTYATLTKEQLEALDDDKLITAVVSNMLAKAEAEKRDPYVVIPKLSTEHCVVYSVWLFQKQLFSDAPEGLRQSGQFGFSELAADGLDFLEQPELGTMLRDYLQTAEDGLVAAMRERVETMVLDKQLADLIRADYAVFCDE